MTDIIHLLPDSVANQIAAGEVVQRPASCLKELVENSLDAGATRVQVIVRDAGRTLLQVVDNGKGMSTTDARMAFERHATSKIASAADLFQLHTMGFRGEALASICAVSQLEMETRREEDEVGTLLELVGSRVVRQEVTTCPVGTNIRVKNLFFNVPARRKFLKTDQTELRNLMQEYYRIVLVYPQVQFTFVSNDEILSELQPGTTKQRIEAVFGHGSKPYSAQLLDLCAESELVSIHGFVGKPETSGKNAQQYLFVNGRYMRHPYFHKAIMTAFSGLLLPDNQPSYFVYFDIDPEAIDVNIHPTKTEIKFADEQPIFQILLACTREALGKFNATPSIDFSTEQSLSIPSFPAAGKPLPTSAPSVHSDAHYNPFHSQPKDTNLKHWQTLYDVPVREVTEQPTLFTIPAIDADTALLQWKNKYILIPVDNGLLLLHQHRLHTAVLYAELVGQLHHHRAVTQALLFPEVMDLEQEEVGVLQEILPDLQDIGFQVEQFTPLSYSITAVPAQLGEKNASKALLHVLHQVQDSGEKAQAKWQQIIALALADQMAITAGQSLTDAQMHDLVERWGKLAESKRILPDGREIFTLISEEDVQKRF